MNSNKFVAPLRLPPQTDPPRSPRETLPTMYDLPSEDPEEPGLPDAFHDYQPQLLRDTFHPPRYTPDRFFVASDMNLYYTVHHLWLLGYLDIAAQQDDARVCLDKPPDATYCVRVFSEGDCDGGAHA